MTRCLIVYLGSGGMEITHILMVTLITISESGALIQVGDLGGEGFQRELGQESQWFPREANTSLGVEKIREKPLMTHDQNLFTASSLHTIPVGHLEVLLVIR